jgi:hypothetical protein
VAIQRVGIYPSLSLVHWPRVVYFRSTDRSYDADWIRALRREGASWPTSRQDAIVTTQSASARFFTVPEIWLSASSTRSNSVAGSLHAMTSSRRTSSPSSSLHQSGCGCALMSPRPCSAMREGRLGCSSTRGGPARTKKSPSLDWGATKRRDAVRGQSQPPDRVSAYRRDWLKVCAILTTSAVIFSRATSRRSASPSRRL